MCLALGYAHPDDLLNNLTAEQITEWEAFNRIQPIGARRFDVYFSHFMTTLHNIAIGFSGNTNAKQFKADDFAPNWTGIIEEEKGMSVEEQKQFWIDFAALQNKRVREQEVEKERDQIPPKILSDEHRVD